MTPSRMKPLLALFLVLSMGLSVNLMFLQPTGGRVAVGRPVPDRVAAKPTAKVMSLAVGEAAPTASLPPATAAVEAIRSGDGPETIRAVQRELHTRGYEAGVEDGVPGLITRAAVLAYEYDYGLPLTAEPSERVLKQILMGEGQPDARPASGQSTGAQAEQVIRTVQQTLAKAGYAVGKVDGRMGEETVRAIREFETDQHLPETGRVSGQLVARLGTLAGQGRLATNR